MRYLLLGPVMLLGAAVGYIVYVALLYVAMHRLNWHPHGRFTNHILPWGLMITGALLALGVLLAIFRFADCASRGPHPDPRRTRRVTRGSDREQLAPPGTVGWRRAKSRAER